MFNRLPISVGHCHVRYCIIYAYYAKERCQRKSYLQKSTTMIYIKQTLA